MKIDLVITDYKMPRMNGARFSIKVKKDHPDIPIVLISTFCPIDLGIQHVVHSYIPKPFDPEVLKIRIESILISENAV
jgi:DNA-binding NarL/FixJ family response regulator